ncbi:hypothetical protein C0991_007957, partial [Blastosporella zonata]
ADVIALGAVFGVSTCSGPIIPYRGGRVDVWEAGLSGVPEPQQDISTHEAIFARAGFTTAEMIQLVACGHTMGGVRSTDFPQLVPPNANSQEPVFEDFDTTIQFDNAVVTQYLDVPHGVTLTDEITVIPAKVHDVQLTFEKSIFVFKASFRLQQAINSTINKNRTVKMLWCDRYGSNQNCNGNTHSSLPATTVDEVATLSPVSQSQGFTFINYNFVVPVDATASIANFWFTVDENNGTLK